MTLDSIMTRHVVTVRMDDELHIIRDMFNKYRFHHVLVLDQCRVVGIVSDRDLLKNTSPFIGKLAERTMDVQCLHRKAHQIMNRSLVSGAPETPIADAALLMINNRISCLPVINNDGACVGIVTTRDLLRWALKQMTDQACAIKLHQEREHEGRARAA